MAKGQGLRWLRKNRLDLATVASIFLSVLVGLVGNYVAGSWSWASLATLVVLAILLAGLEVLRHRLGKHEAPHGSDNRPGSSSAVAVAIENQRDITGDWIIAGGDVYQIHRETKIGGGAVLLIAIVAAGAIMATGRAATESDKPSVTATDLPPGSTSPTLGFSSAFSRSTLIISSEDLDPPKVTNSLVLQP